MSHFAEYVRERLGDEIIEGEKGFATYRFIDDGGVHTVYIVDIFVRSDFRKDRVASEMADQIVEYAKAKGCKRLIGTVSSNAKNPTESIKVLLAYGMEFYKSNNDGLIFKKEL